MSRVRQLAQGLKARVPMHRRRQIAFARLRLRRPTAGLRTLPDFLVIGAQRCGTSSLYKYLGSHPNIVPSLRKEVEYFSTRFPEGEDWYRSHFPTELRSATSRLIRGRRPLTFEATPDYLLDPRAAARAAALVPDAKIVLMVRDPVDRAFSQYHHNRRLGHEPLTFEDALDAEQDRLSGEIDRLLEDPDYQAVALRRFSYQARGHYAEQLRKWLEFYPLEQVMIISSDDLFGDADATLTQLLAFLELPERALETSRNFSYSTGARGSSPVMAPETRKRLAGAFDEPNRRFEALVGRKFGWELRLNQGHSL